MKARYAVALVAVLGLATWWFRPTVAKSALRASGASPSAAFPSRDAKDNDVSGDELDKLAASSAKIEQLQQQLKFKDAVLQKVMMASAVAAQVPEEEKNARIIENTAKILDQRVFDARQDEAASERLETALRQVTAKLPPDVKTEALCGATICRLFIRGTESSLGGAASQLGNSIPKGLFGSTMILPSGEGQTTMYLARNPAQLDVSTEGMPTSSAGSPEQAQPAAPAVPVTK
ncbi:MAG TPA: hypothetical protein VER11_28705 [Polyangiaceae bacterium]|nr:hypothetical protein [Polyangiaceae bacterium]